MFYDKLDENTVDHFLFTAVHVTAFGTYRVHTPRRIACTPCDADPILRGLNSIREYSLHLELAVLKYRVANSTDMSR